MQSACNYFDLIRCSAVFCVVFVHARSNPFLCIYDCLSVFIYIQFIQNFFMELFMTYLNKLIRGIEDLRYEERLLELNVFILEKWQIGSILSSCIKI